jgi:hypothetical protein
MTEDKLEELIKKLEKNGTYFSKPSPDIDKYLSMREWDYANLDLVRLEEAMGRIAEHINYLQAEVNKATARELITGNNFKRKKIIVYGDLSEGQKKGKNSVDERNDLVRVYDKESDELFDKWEWAKVEYFLLQDMQDVCLESLNVMKKIHGDMMLEKNLA